jgi:hypothetical protein
VGRERVSQDVSYDVYVKLGVDHMGRPEFSESIAHFREQSNAVAYKRQEVRGKTVNIHKTTVYDLSETAKAERFMDCEWSVR